MTDITWRKEFNSKILSLENILEKIPDGSTVFIEPGPGEPQYLVDGLKKLIEDKGLKIIYGWSLRAPPDLSPNYFPKPTYYFITKFQREAYARGDVESVPVFLSEIPFFFKQGLISIDVALIQVGAPDAHGQLSLGVSVDITRAALNSAKIVIAQVNRFMPRTHGESFVDFREIDWFVTKSEELPEIHPPIMDSEIEKQLGIQIASLIPDGATVQIGQGRVPSITVKEIYQKKNLGVHSVMISDWVMELMRAGVITNSKKSIHKGKVIASFAIGTKRFYEFLDDSPLFEMKTADYVNDPSVVAAHDLFISINGARTIDLTGQAGGDESDIEFFSNVGGIGEMSVNAIRAPRGRSILVLPSLNENGKSNIVRTLNRDEGALLRRADIDYVVTEYGWVQLRTLSIRERVLSLVNIAHPDHQRELLNYAVNRKLIPVSFPVSLKKKLVDTVDILEGNQKLNIRSASFTDYGYIREIFFSLTDRELMLRFFSGRAQVGKYILESFSNPDYRLILALFEEDGVETPVGMVEFVSTPGKTTDMAIAVSSKYRKLGIAGKLLTCCINLAQQEGIAAIKADVLFQNSPMIKLLTGRQDQWESEEAGASIIFSYKLKSLKE